MLKIIKWKHVILLNQIHMVVLAKKALKLYSCLQLMNLAQNKEKEIYEISHVKITWIGYIQALPTGIFTAFSECISTSHTCKQ